MTSQPNPLSPPQRTPRRTATLNVRMTPQERAAVESLAQRLGVSASHLARHFLMQVAAYYAQRPPQPGETRAVEPTQVQVK